MPDISPIRRSNSKFGYGTNPAFGALGHWGLADMAFRDGPPSAGQWHHLALVFDGVIERIYVDGQLNHAAAKMLLMMPAAPSMLERRSLDLSRCELLTVPPAGGWQEVALV